MKQHRWKVAVHMCSEEKRSLAPYLLYRSLSRIAKILKYLEGRNLKTFKACILIKWNMTLLQEVLSRRLDSFSALKSEPYTRPVWHRHNSFQISLYLKWMLISRKLTSNMIFQISNLLENLYLNISKIISVMCWLAYRPLFKYSHVTLRIDYHNMFWHSPKPFISAQYTIDLVT